MTFFQAENRYRDALVVEATNFDGSGAKYGGLISAEFVAPSP